MDLRAALFALLIMSPRNTSGPTSSSISVASSCPANRAALTKKLLSAGSEAPANSSEAEVSPD